MEEKKKGGRAARYLLLFALAVGADQLLKRYIVKEHIALIAKHYTGNEQFIA